MKPGFYFFWSSLCRLNIASNAAADRIDGVTLVFGWNLIFHCGLLDGFTGLHLNNNPSAIPRFMRFLPEKRRVERTKIRRRP